MDGVVMVPNVPDVSVRELDRVIRTVCLTFSSTG